jgi:hypothetical protein
MSKKLTDWQSELSAGAALFGAEFNNGTLYAPSGKALGLDFGYKNGRIIISGGGHVMATIPPKAANFAKFLSGFYYWEPLRKNPIKRAALARALNLRAKFRETAGTAKDKKPRIKTVSVPKTAAVQIGIGKVLAIEYQLVDEHGKHIKGQAFRHEFTGKSQPMLTTDSAGKQLYFVGGSYRFKTDGINDTKH